MTPSYWPAVRYGGPVRSVHGLCAGLAGQGHEVRVLTTNIDGAGASDVPLDRPLERDGVLISYFAPGLGRRLYRAPAMRRALQDLLCAADVVHLHAAWLWTTYMGARLAERAGTPYLVSPRGMFVRSLIERKSRLLKTATIALVERRTLRQAAAIHVTSQAEAEALADLGLDLAPVALVANGVDEPPPGATGADDPAWADAAPGQRLLYLGRLNWKKGLDRLIRALALLPQARLVIAGNDEEELRPRLERLAVETGVADRIRFTGPVEGASKWRLLCTADLLALPSLSENFGLVVLEALAVGTPVVVTPEVGAAEIVRAHDLGLVAPGEPAPLATALQTLLDDAERRQAAGLRGRQLVRERYGWPAIARQMAGIYARACTGRPVHATVPCSSA